MRGCAAFPEPENTGTAPLESDELGQSGTTVAERDPRGSTLLRVLLSAFDRMVPRVCGHCGSGCALISRIWYFDVVLAMLMRISSIFSFSIARGSFEVTSFSTSCKIRESVALLAVAQQQVTPP